MPFRAEYAGAGNTRLYFGAVKSLALSAIRLCVILLKEGMSSVGTLFLWHRSFLFGSALALIAFCGGIGCSNNFLSESAQRDTPEAIIFEAEKLLNQRLYSEAITQIETLGATDLARRDVVALRASAYAGRCGLDFISLVQSLQNVSVTDSLFEILLTALKSATAYTDCRSAEDLIESIAASAGSRTTNENLLMAFISLAKIGAVLAVDADTDNDGVANAGYNACTAAGGLDDTQAGEIGTAIAHAAQSLSGITGIADTVSSNLTTLCGLLAGACTIVDPAGFSALQLHAIRTAAHDSGSLGLGTQPGVVCP